LHICLSNYQCGYTIPLQPTLSKIPEKIQSPIAPPRRKAAGLRLRLAGKNFSPFKPLQFLPARQKFFTKFFAPSFINHLKTYNLLIITDF